MTGQTEKSPYFVVELFTQAFAVRADSATEAQIRVHSIVDPEDRVVQLNPLDVFMVSQEDPIDLVKNHPGYPAEDILKYRMVRGGVYLPLLK